MSDQATLFHSPGAPAPVKPLTARQQIAFDLVRHAGRAGLAADEVGAELCARKGKHAPDDRCTWCGVSGREVLRALRKKGMVKSRRAGSWYAVAGVTEREHPEEDPWPEGF